MFATAWLSSDSEPQGHQALLRRAISETAHLARWSDSGLLRIPDPDRAAVHFAQLVSAAPGPPTAPPSPREQEAWVAAGVHAFVRGHHR